jgi:hypothetical protein
MPNLAYSIKLFGSAPLWGGRPKFFKTINLLLLSRTGQVKRPKLLKVVSNVDLNR